MIFDTTSNSNDWNKIFTIKLCPICENLLDIDNYNDNKKCSKCSLGIIPYLGVIFKECGPYTVQWYQHITEPPNLNMSILYIEGTLRKSTQGLYPMPLTINESDIQKLLMLQ